MYGRLRHLRKRRDTSTAQDAVRNNVTVPLTQNQFDALTSFTYNTGVNALRHSTLLTKLNQGDYASASNELPKWNKITVSGKKVASEGLSNRRAAEKSLFDTP
jgi:lysozyme